MNRSERRKLQRQGQLVVDRVYHLKDSDIKKIKEDAVKKSINKVFLLLLAIPNMIIHDKWDELEAAKNQGGSKCEELFAAHTIELYDTFDKGYITLEELSTCLYQETGIRVDLGVKDEDDD